MTFETAVFDNSAKQMLEDLFGMSTVYVMDFNNGTFASFVETCIGLDPYQRYEGSKAAILRQIWLNEPFANVAKLNLDLLSKWSSTSFGLARSRRSTSSMLWTRSLPSSRQRRDRPSPRTISPS